MTPDEERLLWQFCDFLRHSSLAICHHVMIGAAPAGTAPERVRWEPLWQPIRRSGGALVEDFGAWRMQHEVRGAQEEGPPDG